MVVVDLVIVSDGVLDFDSVVFSNNKVAVAVAVVTGTSVEAVVVSGAVVVVVVVSDTVVNVVVVSDKVDVVVIAADLGDTKAATSKDHASSISDG